MIEVRNVTKRFGDVEAVRGISFQVGAGEITGFLGPNGAGKTTTMRILAGIFPPTSGEVRIAGYDPQTDPLACRRAVGYFPEYAPFYPDLTVVGYLRFVARMKRIARRERGAAIEKVLAACGLEHMARRRVGTLSKGYRQRVGIAQALLGDPPILILDEPTIGLDPAQVVEIRDLLRGFRRDRTVLFSSHILSEVEALCERVVVIAHGQLVGEGTPAELSRQLGNCTRLVLRVDAPVERVVVLLNGLPGVLRVQCSNGAFVIEASGEPGLARVASEAVQRAGWPLLELRQEELDLEDIFLALVRTGTQP